MTISEKDYEAFTDFEKAAWVRLVERYDALAGQMTRQAIGPVLDAVRAGPGTAVLDVATGFGYVAAEAIRRGASVTALDFSSDMIAQAHRYSPDVKIEQGNAEEMRYADASFDAVVCAFGMLHFPRPGKALSEAYRVLRPGGRHAFTVWCGPAKTKLFAMVGDTITQFADPATDLPYGPSQFMFSDPLVCVSVMDAAGFVDVQVEEVPSYFTVKSADDVLEFMLKCAVRGTHIYKQQAPAVQRKIEDALLAHGTAALTVDGGKVPCPALLVSGVKPVRH